MTQTDKPVTRVSLGSYPCQTGLSGRGFGKSRPIAATLGPGDVITLRWGGTQQKFQIPIEYIMRRAAQIELRTRAAEKSKRRRK